MTVGITASGYVLGAGSYVPVGSHSLGQMLAQEAAGHRVGMAKTAVSKLISATQPAWD